VRSFALMLKQEGLVAQALRKVKVRQTSKSYARRKRHRRVETPIVLSIPAASLINREFLLACLVASLAGWTLGFMIAPLHAP
jgi:hypothetical protein